VSEITSMSYEELLGWFNYFERRPVDWRDDDRTSKILKSNGAKIDSLKIFPSLQAVYKQAQTENEEGFNVSSLRSSSMFQRMLRAKNGDKINLS
jgi:hypothetical protein